MIEVKESGIVPRALRDRPALKPQNRHLLEAFYEVSAGRSIGEVPQPITAVDIKAYCELMGISAQPERESLFRLLRRLDGVFLREVTKKIAAEIPRK